jgi:hypothetical protein
MKMLTQYSATIGAANTAWFQGSVLGVSRCSGLLNSLRSFGPCLRKSGVRSGESGRLVLVAILSLGGG